MTIAQEIDRELREASKKFKPFGSAHEAYAVIQEEVDEFWESVKNKNPSRRELVQIGAMAIRALRELDFNESR